MKAAEANFKCAGTCNPPLFYITKDISEGQPYQECLNLILPGLKKQIQIVATTTMLLAIFALFGFLASLPLCTPMKKEKRKKRQIFEYED